MKTFGSGRKSRKTFFHLVVSFDHMTIKKSTIISQCLNKENMRIFYFLALLGSQPVNLTIMTDGSDSI